MEANVQLCRICVTNSVSSTMMSIFGQDALWKKIKTFADVEIEEGDNLPQQVCVSCAKNAINACLFKKKCEEADSYYRHQLTKKLDIPQDVITISESSDNEDNYDFSSICLSDQVSLNGVHNGNSENSVDDEHLPLIPEIELITPNDNLNANQKQPEDETHNYQCRLCYSIFQKKEILKHHMIACHTKRTPMYECFNCKKTYLYKRFLEKHVRRGRCKKRRRNQTRPMQCSDCHVLFQSGHHLGWHKRTGCPSRRSTQETVAENIIQYNNFPTKNSLYIYNRRKFITNPKRKGRTRIKLDAKKIALAKQLILKEATTSKIAEELDISRTFAWRLRKNLVNGINLQERVIEPTDDSVEGKLKIDEDIDEKTPQDNTFYDTVSSSIPQDLSNPNYVQTPLPLVVKMEEVTTTEVNIATTEEDSPKEQFEENNLYIDENEDEIDNDMCSNYHVVSPKPGCSNQVSENMESNSENSFSIENMQNKKSRKPNVFLDEEKYAKAKILLAQNTSTMELAQQLNVSQMTAWKLRDAIMKGIPLKFRCKSSPKTLQERQKICERLMKPRRRLKAAERVERDKEITRELLTLIKEDSNLQYWKISEKMSEKGFQLSPSSVCQKLKALGLHRRWKSGDRSQVLDSSVKFNESINDGGSFNYNNENQLNMSGAHFLSAFTD